MNATGTLLLGATENGGLLISNTGGLARDVDATQCAVTATPATLPAGGTTTITVTVRDASSQPLAGRTVVLAATGRTNTIVQPLTTGTDGVATGMLASDFPEAKTVTATLSPGPGSVTIAQTANVTFTTNAAMSDAITLTAVEGLVTGDEQFHEWSDELAAAIANDPTNENAKLGKSLADFGAWLKDSLFDPSPSVGKLRDLMLRAGFENVNETTGRLRDFTAKRIANFVPTTSPTTADLLAFLDNDAAPQIDALIAQFSAMSPSFAYHVNIDSKGQAFDASAIDDTTGVDLTYGDIRVALSQLQELRAAIHAAHGYDWSSIPFSDIDTRATPAGDPLAAIVAHPTAGTVVSVPELQTAQTGLDTAFSTYKAGADLIRGETNAQFNSGILTFGRGAATATITSRLDLETHIRSFVQGMLDSSFVNTDYTTSVAPDGTGMGALTVRLFNFFNGLVDARALFLKSVTDPIRSKTVPGVTDLSQLSGPTLTANGTVTQLFGAAPAAGDLRRWHDHGTAYSVRVDAPPSSTKTIDGGFTDWATQGTDYFRVASSPVATVKSDSLGNRTDFGALDISVDATNLYIRSTADLSSPTGPIDVMKIEVQGQSGGAAAVNFDRKNPLAVFANVSDTTNFHVGDTVTDGSATGVITFVNRPTVNGQIQDATGFTQGDTVTNGSGGTGVLTFVSHAINVNAANSGFFNLSDRVDNGAGATGTVFNVPTLNASLQAPIVVNAGDAVNDGAGATGTITQVFGSPTFSLFLSAPAVGFGVGDPVTNPAGGTGTINQITTWIDVIPTNYSAVDPGDNVGDGAGATGLVEFVPTVFLAVSDPTGFNVNDNVSSGSGATGIIRSVNGSSLQIRITGTTNWNLAGDTITDTTTSRGTTYGAASQDVLRIRITGGSWQMNGTIFDATKSTTTAYGSGVLQAPQVQLTVTGGIWPNTTNITDTASSTTIGYFSGNGFGPSVNVRITGGSWNANGTLFDPTTSASSPYQFALVQSLGITVTSGSWAPTGTINDQTTSGSTTYSGGSVPPTGFNVMITSGTWLTGDTLTDNATSASTSYSFGFVQLQQSMRWTVTSGTWGLPSGSITDTTTGAPATYSGANLSGTLPVTGASLPTVSAHTAQGYEMAIPLSNFGSDTYVSLTRTYDGQGAKAERADRVIIKVR